MTKTHKSLLVRVSDVAENYGAILLAGLLVVGCALLYGHFYDNEAVFRLALWGGLLFVFGPPAVLMSSYLIASLLGRIRPGRRAGRASDETGES